MASTNSLMLGGYEPDVYDIEPNWVPDIECQYVVVYQTDSKIYNNTFTVFEGESEDWIFNKALEFARAHDTIVFYRELDYQYFHPKTGEKVDTPQPTGTDYYQQPVQPYTNHMFVPCELDELPF